MVSELEFIRVFFFALPIYVANGSAMAIRGRVPLDFGKNFWDGRRWFGNGKTFRGTIFGILMGLVTTLAVATIVPTYVFSNYVLLGFLISFGAIFADIVGSFIKRRMFMKSGEPAFLLDQLDFVVGAFVFGSFTYLPNWNEFSILIIFTVIAHSLSNWVAYLFKLKKVPW